MTYQVNELRHKNFGISHELRHTILHGAEVKISTELVAEFNILCRSPQLGAEVICVEHLPHDQQSLLAVDLMFLKKSLRMFHV